MGRDHTIYATESGYVKYYKDPDKHPDRQYIGIVFERDQRLPVPRNAPRRRRLNMLAVKIDSPTPQIADTETIVRTDLLVEGGGRTPVSVGVKTGKVKKIESPLKLRPGYMYRESNWEIGRAAEKANVQVKLFKPRDRWTAWRKRAVRAARSKDKRNLSRNIR